MTYGMEVVVPIELEVPTARVITYDLLTNEEAKIASLDLVEELQTTY